jgi:hypothetical protein
MFTCAKILNPIIVKKTNVQRIKWLDSWNAYIKTTDKAQIIPHALMNKYLLAFLKKIQKSVKSGTIAI